MLHTTNAWFAERTWQSPEWTVAELVAAKGSRRVSVVLPALNEESTVATVVASVLPYTHGPEPLVDELVVLDSGSTDRTIEVARAAGARVVRRSEVLPHLEPLPGKGEVLWRSLAATTGDVLVFIDSDLVDPDPSYVTALLGPMLTCPGVHLAKAFYRRPLRLGDTEDASGGGRVTELLARPVLAALRPELGGIVQPLGGEYAASREFLESVPFAAGYGVEIGLLLDAHAMYGLNGLAQVNLGVRKHRNRPLHQLGRMARQILGTALARAGVSAATDVPFTQFVQVMGEWLPDSNEVLIADRPPMSSVLAANPSADQRVAMPPPRV
jgi:glucosyl-3-phosphoglycerate synthase